MFARAMLLLASSLLACGGAPQRPRPSPLQDAHAFERLSAIAGSWESTTDGATTTASYELVSRGSALVETWVTAGGTRTLTVYHPDHETVLLTHYCAQGNQARLRLTAATGRSFQFEREDATNVLPDQSILTLLALALEGDTLLRRETYVDAAGTPEETVMRFVRVLPPSPTPR